MVTGRASRPTGSANEASSLMQDVPGTLPAPPPPVTPLPSVAQEDDEDSDREGNEGFTSLPAALYARRADYVRPKHIRIKIGTWNVASCKGTEKDLGGWFVEGKGLDEVLARLSSHGKEHEGRQNEDAAGNEVEEVAAQEERYLRKTTTLPKGETGSVLPSNEEVGMYVLGLQEIVDVNSAQEALRPYNDPSIAKKWKDELGKALPEGYRLVAEQQLIGLLLLIYASPEVANEVKSVSTTSVGTGLMGYMGNKGAVTARLVLGETTRLVFVNSHLAAGADPGALERRNWDAAQIVSRTRFEPIRDTMDLAQTTGEQIGDEDFAFWVGDLNYRLEGIPGDDVRRLLMLHTRNKFDLSAKSAKKIDKELSNANESVERRVGERQSINSSGSASIYLPPPPDQIGDEDVPESTVTDDEEDQLDPESDPASLQTTLLSLLPHDELQQQMKRRQAFHDGWREGEIKFLPTYKYDVGCVGVFDSSEKRRAPSWCDRILYRTRRDKLAYEAMIQEEELARKKDEEMKANGLAQAAADEDILYDYDPDADGIELQKDDYDEYEDNDEHGCAGSGIVVTKEGFEDEIELEYYVAHQRVLSSDHKPLDAIFKMKYDAVVPELKANVLNEVAREMDKRENEGRPNVTVVVDKHGAHDVETTDEDPQRFPGIYLGDVHWGEGKHRTLTIANTSRVPANIKFIERPVGAGQAPGIAPRWLNVKFSDKSVKSSSHESPGFQLDPGDTCPVEISLRIFDMEVVRGLNEGIKQLEDVLVLRVENGRDHFIPIRGNWQNTSLGQSIDRLIRVPEGGIRRLQGQKPHGRRKAASSAGSSVISVNTSSDTATSPTYQRSPGDIGDDEQQPVRSSAPRELFRLTEAIEELSTRVMAEWKMTNAPASSQNSTPESEVLKPPWHRFPAWPFDEQAWTAEQQDEESRLEWEFMLSEACEALDTERPLHEAFPLDIPRIRKLYILCALLLVFLQGIVDGIVTAEAWAHIEGYLITNVEKGKRNSQTLSEDAIKIAIQEILVQCSTSAHSVSFLLVINLLQRLQADILGASIALSKSERQSQDEYATSSPTGPDSKRRSGMGSFRRLTGFVSRIAASEAAARVLTEVQQGEKARGAVAKVFIDAIIRTEAPGSEKAKAAQIKRKSEVLEMFIKKDEPG
ncbi:inositol polyphosphate 5-phosphatase [Polychaeton citri CBS 116435]|uniref:Inositol polyphosphate 5-phosphatase n=1 Tax=Polychaeton citri CBS 116435 TaxID=1314669 RepID=A0A9P4Q7U5_9PEZI|nr:inositol polyphosphate 5-phosphatase [Polychaeton citri CBS 116435]